MVHKCWWAARCPDKIPQLDVANPRLAYDGERLLTEPVFGDEVTQHDPLRHRICCRAKHQEVLDLRRVPLVV
jgi:hypothetical protein